MAKTRFRITDLVVPRGLSEPSAPFEQTVVAQWVALCRPRQRKVDFAAVNELRTQTILKPRACAGRRSLRSGFLIFKALAVGGHIGGRELRCMSATHQSRRKAHSMCEGGSDEAHQEGEDQRCFQHPSILG